MKQSQSLLKLTHSKKRLLINLALGHRWKKQYVKLHSPYYQICKKKPSYRDGPPVVANTACNRKTFSPLVNQPTPFDFDRFGLIVCLSLPLIPPFPKPMLYILPKPQKIHLL